jgi:LCP family protein required for cell wall assembly
VPTTALTKDIIHILLIGGDRNYALDMNTDTLIVAVINRSTKQVSLLSIPRDLWVHIPIYGWGRINIAHRFGARTKYPEGGGPGLLARTIEDNLGVPIDHWVRINYDGFANAVDKLGGVDMLIPCRVNLRYVPPTSEDEPEMFLEAGMHHLDGLTALRYVRTRRGDSDFERSHRQQQFLRAVWHQFKDPDIIPRLPGLWAALKDSYSTDLKLGDVLALAPVALDLQPHRVRSLYIGYGQVEGWTTPDGYRVQVPIPERVEEVVARLYAPPANDDGIAAEAARIRVLNGTDRSQLSLIGADQLRWRGFQVVDTGQADRNNYNRTRIIIYNDKPRAVESLTRLLGVRPKNVLHEPDSGLPEGAVQADLVVILGADYDPCR